LFPCNIKRKAGRRIRTDDLLITNQLLYQLSYAGILRAERPPLAAISVLTVYAIFYGMPVGRMERGASLCGINVVLAIIEASAQIKK
jgi:hypothetical protein